MKTVRNILIILLMVVIFTTTALATGNDGFNAGIAVDKSVEGQISVTVADSSILAEKRPTLSIPCDYVYAKVTAPDAESTVEYCIITDGEVTFTVFIGGTYVIEKVDSLPPESGDGDDGGDNEGGTEGEGGGGQVTPPAGGGTVTPPVSGGNTTVNPDGSTTTTETKNDGTVVETTKAPDGSVSTTTTDSTGAVSTEVKLSQSAINAAEKSGKALELPMTAVEAADTTEKAPEITVTTNSAKPVKVEVPVENVTPGTVAVIVNPDGTETIIQESVPTENGIEVELEDGATVKIVDNSKKFDDVKSGDWYKDAVDFASARGIVNGIGDDEFGHDTVTTRAMVWTMLARLEGVDTTTGDTWYAVGREWAMAKGISDGTNGDGKITREQLVTMIWRYFGEKASDYDLSDFDDHGDTSEWAKTAKQWAVEHGVISGVGQADGTSTLDPQGDASRVQVAQIFYNFITKFK